MQLPVARLALIAQLGTTLPLVGLIWMVQVVSYPQFGNVGSSEFVAYHSAHSRLITWVVGPLMLGELVASIVSVVQSDVSMPKSWALFGLLLAISVWLVTAFVSVPMHDSLTKGFSPSVHQWLVRTNWLRTLIWTLRGGMLLVTMARVLESRR